MKRLISTDDLDARDEAAAARALAAFAERQRQQRLNEFHDRAVAFLQNKDGDRTLFWNGR